MHIKVDIADVSKLNFIANRISSDAMLVSKLCGLVCVTIQTTSDRINAVRSSVIETVRILNVDLLSNIYSKIPQRSRSFVLSLIDVLIIHPSALYIGSLIELMYEWLDI